MYDAIDYYKRQNRLQTFALLGVLLLIMLVAGWSVLGPTGLILAILGFGISVALFSRFGALATVSGAQRISASHAPELIVMVTELSRRAGLSRAPELYYLPTRMMNAAAVGDPDHPMLHVTDGLLRRLSQRELAAVIAHEISHVRNRDLAVFRFADTLRRLTDTVAKFGLVLLAFSLPALVTGDGLPTGPVLLLVAAPSLSLGLQLAVMRTREFGADLGAAELTQDPTALASALRKLEYPRSGMVRVGEEHQRLFRTHPSTDERVERLLDLTRITGSGRRRLLHA